VKDEYEKDQFVYLIKYNNNNIIKMISQQHSTDKWYIHNNAVIQLQYQQ